MKIDLETAISGILALVILAVSFGILWWQHDNCSTRCGGGDAFRVVVPP